MPPLSKRKRTCIPQQVSVPRRALRGHAPLRRASQRRGRSRVSVPRRALRGHAPWPVYVQEQAPARTRFSAPKGVERACPLMSPAIAYAPDSCFSAPKGVERACPPKHPIFIVCTAGSFSAPKGVERACPRNQFTTSFNLESVSVPRRALRGHAPLKCRATDLL